MLSLRCLWVIRLEMSNGQAEIWVWSLGERTVTEYLSDDTFPLNVHSSSLAKATVDGLVGKCHSDNLGVVSLS